MKKPVALLAVVILIVMAIGLSNQPETSLEELFDVARFNAHIEALTRPELDGRYTGTEGNREAIAYIASVLDEEGVVPLGDGGYAKAFTTPALQVEEAPVLVIGDGDGGELLRYETPDDFVVDSWETMNDIDYSGDLLVLMGTIYTVDPKYMKDKVIFTAVTRLLPETVEGFIEAGAKGVIYYSTEPQGNAWDDPNEIGNRYPQIDHKNGEPFFVARVPMEIFQEVGSLATDDPIPEHCVKRTNSEAWLDFTGWVHDVTLKADYSYPVVDSANLYGMIPADRSTSRTLVLAANLDGLGRENGDVYPGAVNNASGVAFLLETARMLTDADRPLDVNVVFAFVNGHYQGNMGMKELAESPPFDPQESEMLIVEGIGGDSEAGAALYHNSHTADDPAGIMYTQLLQYAEDLGLDMETSYQRAINNGYPLSDGEMPVITYVSDIYLHTLASPADTPDKISSEEAVKDSLLIHRFIQSDVFGASTFDWIQEIPVAVWLALAVWFMILFVVRQMPSWYREWAIFERISLTLNGMTASAGIMAVMFFGLLFVLLLPGYFMVGVRGGELITNYSAALSAKKTFLFIEGFFDIQTLSEQFMGEGWPLVMSSLKLLLPSLFLAGVFGMAKGLLDGLSRHSIHRLVSVGLYSVPDGFVAMIGLLVLVWLAKNGYLPEGFDVQDARLFIIPILLLSIVPAIYITATVSLVVTEIKNQPFYKSLRARGIPESRIVVGHVLPIAFTRLMETMPTIVSVSLANLFIIEYLYAYPGLGSYVIKNIWLPDKVIYFSLGIGMVYLMLNFLFRFVAWLMTFRRKGMQHEL